MLFQMQDINEQSLPQKSYHTARKTKSPSANCGKHLLCNQENVLP